MMKDVVFLNVPGAKVNQGPEEHPLELGKEWSRKPSWTPRGSIDSNWSALRPSLYDGVEKLRLKRRWASRRVGERTSLL